MVVGIPGYTHLYKDYFISHEIGVPIDQAVFHGNVIGVLNVG